MDALKKIGAMLLLLLWAGGIICAIILAVIAKASIVVDIAIAILGLMSIPTVTRIYKFLVS